MFKKKNRSKKRSRAMLSAYSIIMILIILLGILSHALPKAKFAPIAEGEEVPTVEVGGGEWEGEVIGDDATEEQPLVVELTEVKPVEELDTELIAEEVTYDSLAECEEEYGEDGCAIVDG